jgi:hypothetical protein
LPDHRDLLERREQRYEPVPHDVRWIHNQDVDSTMMRSRHPTQYRTATYRDVSICPTGEP